MGFAVFSKSLESYYTFLLGFYWVSLGFTGLYWVVLGCTGFYWDLLSFVEFEVVYLGYRDLI